MTGWGQEIGPFNLHLQFADPANTTSPVTGVTLTENPYAFNAAANVLYIDNPVGTGLSYSDDPDDDYSTNDTQTQADLYQVMLSFFDLWPELQSRDFYIAGRLPHEALSVYHWQRLSGRGGIANAISL